MKERDDFMKKYCKNTFKADTDYIEMKKQRLNEKPHEVKTHCTFTPALSKVPDYIKDLMDEKKEEKNKKNEDDPEEEEEEKEEKKDKVFIPKA